MADEPTSVADSQAAWPTVHTGDPHIIAASRYTQHTERLPCKNAAKIRGGQSDGDHHRC